jgi:hypothetical protein
VGGVPVPVRGAIVVVAGGQNSPRRPVPGRSESSWLPGSGSTMSPAPKSRAPEVLKYLVFRGEPP